MSARRGVGVISVLTSITLLHLMAASNPPENLDNHAHYPPQQSRGNGNISKTVHIPILLQGKKHDSAQNKAIHIPILPQGKKHDSAQNKAIHIPILPQGKKHDSAQNKAIHMPILPQGKKHDSAQNKAIHIPILPQGKKIDSAGNSNKTVHIPILPQGSENDSVRNKTVPILPIYLRYPRDILILPQGSGNDGAGNKAVHIPILAQGSENDSARNSNKTVRVPILPQGSGMEVKNRVLGVKSASSSPGVSAILSGGNSSIEVLATRPATSPVHRSDQHDLQCVAAPSCSARDAHSQREAANRSPCMCDALCLLYGDCCRDHASASLPRPALRPSCRLLTPLAGRPYAAHRTVFLVDRCPAGTEAQLAGKCMGQQTPPSHLQDIPVFSNTSGIGYNNIFCATCHNDTDILELEMSITCIGNITSTTELEAMIYHAGELRWTSDTSHTDAEEDTELSCLLDIAFPPSIGRWCQSELIDTCREEQPVEQVRRCATYNYYVQRGSDVYKNIDCALCNGVPQGEIQCLNLFRLRTWSSPPPSLTELFRVRGDCRDDEVWDALYRRCEHVSCGLLFTLTDGKCERRNATTPKHGQSYLNASCYVLEYRQNLSVIFPNHSIFLNATHRIYHYGEYEMNGSRVSVCEEKQRWTLNMYIISTVLISISLVCLALHMVIFILLPKRRNIPSKNLFSMTVSLFMAEFIYVTFFQLKINYIVCVVSGVLMYYFLGVSFLWMNVMSVDIFRTFYSNTYRTMSGTIFIQYSLYAWLLPIISVIVAPLVDHVWPDVIIAPHFGTDTCWFNNKWGLVLFFTLPSGMVILFNMVLYIVSVYNIYHQMQVSELASSTVVRKGDAFGKRAGSHRKKNRAVETSNTKRKVRVAAKKSDNDANHPSCKERLRDKLPRGFLRKHRTRLILYCKLALIMGLTWIFAFISIHTKNIVFEYLFIICNGLQGTFIFVSFDLKKTIWREVLHKIRCRGESDSGSSGFKAEQHVKTSDSYNKDREHSRQAGGIQGHEDSISVMKTQPSHEAESKL